MTDFLPRIAALEKLLDCKKRRLEEAERLAEPGIPTEEIMRRRKAYREKWWADRD